MSTRRWLRMSWWNALLVVAVLCGGVTLALLDRWGSAGILLLVALFTGASAVYARSGRASDVTRLNAAEYADERDRAAATRGFAAVGVVALLLSLAVLVTGQVLLEPGSAMRVVLWLQFIGLVVAWGVANVVALRRS
ncbi:hypothetical protein [Agrococcus carbonis]|uniref:Uncharacterized protein n=1 Tax=Agrococcus carbonis TaxID=684552 RepID=A0A1H1MA60_9MICO|nr:hypothetical protein [Agrococcus carbonis]SDR83673.1 hypothetical protein SAMN04489719_0915 [Agrococcus carbonis]